MDYNDIDKIAESLTDDLKTNNGLTKGISMHKPATQPSRNYDHDYDIPSKYAFPSGTQRKAKSVTLLEMGGYRCVNAAQKELHNYHASKPAPPPTPPAPAPQKPTEALSRGRVLEL